MRLIVENSKQDLEKKCSQTCDKGIHEPQVLNCRRSGNTSRRRLLREQGGRTWFSFCRRTESRDQINPSIPKCLVAAIKAIAPMPFAALPLSRHLFRPTRDSDDRDSSSSAS